MIAIVRERSEAAIPVRFRGEKRIAQALKLLESIDEFDSGYWKPAKKQLVKESFGKCAYCEATTYTVAHGDVEHFRPKSVYWWLAYCYDNYLFACQICNQTYKGNNFPLKNDQTRLVPPQLLTGASPAQKREFVRRFAPDPLDTSDGMDWDDFAQLCKGEKASLLNPYFDEPEKHLIWEANLDLREVAVKARNAQSQHIFEAARDFYGLNRPEMLNERYRVYGLLELFKNFLATPTSDAQLKTETKNMLIEMMKPSSPFAGMCRYFVREKWSLNL